VQVRVAPEYPEYGNSGSVRSGSSSGGNPASCASEMVLRKQKALAKLAAAIRRFMEISP
jgi:hypothetical protein